MYPYGRHLIEQSAVHPLVSGFYKLFALTLQLGEDAGYFDDDDKSVAEKARTAGTDKSEAGRTPCNEPDNASSI